MDKSGPFKLSISKSADDAREALSADSTQEYLPGYTKSEADTHFKELCRTDNWSERDIQFLLNYERKKESPANLQPESCEKSAAMAPVTITGDVEKERFLRAKFDEDKPQLASAESKLLKTGAGAEQIAWRDWQERLNKSIYEKFSDVARGRNFPPGLSCECDYKVGRDGSFQWSIAKPSGDATYDRAIEKVLDDTLRYHPELLKFPEGSRRKEYARKNVSFTSGGRSRFTGVVDDEINRL